MQNINVLLVEDDIGFVGLQSFLLSHVQDVKFNIELARTLSEAMELLQLNKFDITLMDLNLPDSEGLKYYFGYKRV